MRMDDRTKPGDGNGPPGPETLPGIPRGLPSTAVFHSHEVAEGHVLPILVIPLEASAEASEVLNRNADIVEIVREWVARVSPHQPSMAVPLYDCCAFWSPKGGAIVAPSDRVTSLEQAVVDFAGHERALSDIERQTAVLMEAIDGDSAGLVETAGMSREQRATMVGRYREALGICNRLAAMAPAVRTPPVHPPTLTSQLGERLRDRSRLVERHELATDKAELVERAAESWSQRAIELGVAREQIGLEWAIVVLLIVQTALLLVDLLSRQVST